MVQVRLGQLAGVASELQRPEPLATLPSMSDPNLTSDERQVLGAMLLDKDAGPADKTVEKISERTGLAESQVRQTLSKLEDLEPPYVHREVDQGLDIEFWILLVRGAEELEPESG